jgi:hypothetical protein
LTSGSFVSVSGDSAWFVSMYAITIAFATSQGRKQPKRKPSGPSHSASDSQKAAPRAVSSNAYRCWRGFR